METELEGFLQEATRWAEGRRDVVGLALVGSHARDEARPDSDIDLVILSMDAGSLLRARGWTTRFGVVRRIEIEDYGPTQSLRVFYRDGREVEFGITDPTWTNLPLDPGTRHVLLDGVRILYDPRGLLGAARDAAVA